MPSTLNRAIEGVAFSSLDYQVNRSINAGVDGASSDLAPSQTLRPVPRESVESAGRDAGSLKLNKNSDIQLARQIISSDNRWTSRCS